MKNFTIYRSSAGSGKTYRLVIEYLKLVLRDPSQYKHILGVTFTNKATAEFKERILEKLLLLSRSEDPGLEKLLIEQGLTFDIRKQAERAFNEIIHNYSYFSIVTIDSFFHKIIRSFSREFELPFSFDIEMNEDKVVSSAIDGLFSSIDEEPELEKYLSLFINETIAATGNWNIEFKIRKMAEQLLGDKYFLLKKKKDSSSKEKLHEIIEVLNANESKFINDVIDLKNKASAKLDKYNLKPEEFKKKDGSDVAGLFNKINKRDYETYKAQYFERILNKKIDWFAKSPAPKPEKVKNLTKAIEEGLDEDLAAIVKFIRENEYIYHTALILKDYIFLKGITNDLEKEINGYKIYNNVFLMSDTAKILSAKIGKEDTPYIYEKIGNRYNHYLIDEFQDTSSLQWRNFLPLIKDSLAGGKYVTLVGDVKQAIYRWRNSDIELFNKQAKKDLKIFLEMLQEIPLDKNFRSGKPLVEFFNTFFQYALQYAVTLKDIIPDEVQSIYSDAKQDPFYNKKGYAEITVLTKHEADEDEEDEEEKSTNELLTEEVLLKVKTALSQGYKHNDITILSRNNKEAIASAAALIQANIPVSSSESLLLASSYKVKLLLHFLQYCISDDPIAARFILYYYIKYCSRLKIDAHTIFTKDEASKLLFDKHLKEKLNEIKYSASSLSEMAIAFCNALGNAMEMDVHLSSFIDTVLDYERRFGSSIFEFLEWWDEESEKLSAKAFEDNSSVNVMTIHKAKGLQNKVIIIAGASWELYDSEKSSIWVSSKQEVIEEGSPYLVRAKSVLRKTEFKDEYIKERTYSVIDNYNLLYVAFTRAEECLYAIVNETKSSSVGSLIVNVCQMMNMHTEEEPGRTIYSAGKS